ncbi:hypothetical protein HPB48_008066 [Haemaphysalis longicornis]|uniref:Uncharacterized protein n=1 Tax=Haemaphysalis longicornis TaxID=44386 RepID=A0A9J6FXI7_HAELO|nr:hypothetical protein HPB48_008066 [Haemaphysalis longicornis]
MDDKRGETQRDSRRSTPKLFFHDMFECVCLTGVRETLVLYNPCCRGQTAPVFTFWLVIAVSAIAYVAAVLTLFGSALLVHKVTQTGQQLFQCTSLGPERLPPGQPNNASHELPPCAVPSLALAASGQLPEECLPASPPGLLSPRAFPCQRHSKQGALPP